MADAAPELVVHQDAAELIREKGGAVYLSVDGAGMEHVHFRSPRRFGLDWQELDADGIRVFVDPRIAVPDRWLVKLSHFPFRHVRVLWNGQEIESGGYGSDAGVFLSGRL